MKFPTTVKFSVYPVKDGKHPWIVTDRSGAWLAGGDSPNRPRARLAAWHALEEMGLVTDE